MEDARETGATIRLVNDPFEAAKAADIVVTDTWASMGQEAEHDERKKIFKDYQVNVTTRMPEWLLNATEIERESYKIPEKEAFESDTEKVKELTEKLAKSHVIAQLLKKISYLYLLYF